VKELGDQELRLTHLLSSTSGRSAERGYEEPLYEPPINILALKRKAHTSVPRGEDPWRLRGFCSVQATKPTSHCHLSLTPKDSGRSKR
jgi:hypothetical protein